jgi:cob(I)alamin adenosyltransferase
MANRLSTITTRTGDNGTTGLGDGSRVSKDHARINAMGDVDELNSSLGVLLAEPLPDEIRVLLTEIQHDLFDLGGELSIPGYELLNTDRLRVLDQAIDHWMRHCRDWLNLFCRAAAGPRHWPMSHGQLHGVPSAVWCISRPHRQCVTKSTST